MRFGWLALFAVVAYLSAGTFPDADARDIYVDNRNGDDRNDGSQPSIGSVGVGPCRTVTRALKHAQKGDRIILADTGEPYRESITLQGGRHSGSADIPFVIVGNGATLDGTSAVDASAWECVDGDLFRFRPSFMSFQQLFLDGRPCDRVRVSDKPALESLEPLQWTLYRGHVYFRTEENRIPQQYDLTHSDLRVGVTLYAVRHVQILDLTVQGFALDGINAHDSVFDVDLAGITSRGNGRSGLSVGGACRLELAASLIGSNGTAQVRGEGMATISVENCDVIDDDSNAPGFDINGKSRLLIDGEAVAN